MESGGIRGTLPFISRSRGAGVLSTTEEPSSPSQRAAARAPAKKRRTKGFERREAIFDLFVSGFSHQRIAKALNTSTATVRRIIDCAVADRRLDAPERFAAVQVARLSKALSHVDAKLEQGEIRAYAPYQDRRRARPPSRAGCPTAWSERRRRRAPAPPGRLPVWRERRALKAEELSLDKRSEICSSYVLRSRYGGRPGPLPSNSPRSCAERARSRPLGCVSKEGRC